MSFNRILRGGEPKPNGASEPEIANPILVAQRGSENFVAALHLDPSQLVVLRAASKKLRMPVAQYLQARLNATFRKEKE